VNFGGWLLWGFSATLVMTTIMSSALWLNLTRMSLPFMLGTIFTSDRDRAKVIGFFIHLVNGWIFSLFYIALFTSWNRANWWLGAAVGLVHAAAVLTMGMRVLPGLHPRMASELRGPTVTRQLEPPGFLARNYGHQTALTVFLAHVVYGAILGAFYHFPKH
jgi:hypothetical protein